MRFNGWRRLRGDTAERPDLLDLGKKLLAYLAEQRRLSGNKTLAIQRELPDGSVVRARWDGDLPQIEVLAASPGPVRPQEPITIEGLVVAPGGALPGLMNEVLLQPSDADNWKVHFYDGAEVPADYAPKVFYYGWRGSRPLLTEPEGLDNVGVVDWRNDEETMSVSWYGPYSRYFAENSSRDTKVFYKGKLLFNVTSIESALIGRTGGLVAGACLRRSGGGLDLLVAVRYGSDFGGTNRLDVFYLVPLRLPVGHRVPPDSKIEQMPRLEAVTASATVLMQYTLPTTMNDTQHPWCFNGSGTEARCIRHTFYTTVHELVAGLKDLTQPSMTVIDEPWRTVSYIDTGTENYSTVKAVGTHQVFRDPSVYGTPQVKTYTLTGLRTTSINTGADQDWQYDYCTGMDRLTRAVPAGKMRCAVDYIGDLPVYAYYLPETYTRTRTASSDRSFSTSSTISGTNAVSPGVDSVAANGTLNAASTWSETVSKVGYEWALETDWGTWTRTHLDATTTTGSASNALTWSWNSSGVDLLLAGYHYWSLPTSGVTRAIDYALASDVTTGAKGIATVIHLDLRKKILAYLESESSVRTVVATLADYDASTPDTGGLDQVTPVSQDTLAGVADTYRYEDQVAGTAYFAVNIQNGARNQTVTNRSISSVVVATTNGAELVRQIKTNTVTVSPTTGFAINGYWGFLTKVQRIGTFGAKFFGLDFRTQAQWWNVANYTDTVNNVVANNAGNQPALTGLAGQVQAYKNHYAVSLKYIVGPDTYLNRVGRINPPLASAFGLDVLTGYTATPQIYYPLGILPPTSPAQIS